MKIAGKDIRIERETDFYNLCNRWWHVKTAGGDKVISVCREKYVSGKTEWWCSINYDLFLANGLKSMSVDFHPTLRSLSVAARGQMDHMIGEALAKRWAGVEL